MMKILVLGFGPHGSGLDAAEYYKSYGHDVTLLDSSNRELVSNLYGKLEKLGVKVINDEITASEIKTYDIVVKAPTVPIAPSVLKAANEITNDLAALLKDDMAEKMKKIVIVGSTGKTNIASAVVHSLNLLGAKSVMCGSIGMSGFNILQDINEKGKCCYTHLIIEMTTWQINDTFHALHDSWPDLDIVFLTRKANERRAEKKETYSIFGPWVKKAIIEKKAKDVFLKNIKSRPGKLIYTPTSFNPNRNIEPLESAYEILKALGYHKRDIEKALSTYKGIPNRTEQVAFKDSILYINDSAATIPEAVAFTVKMIGQASIHLICGGSDKSGEIDPVGMKVPFKMASSITLLSGSFTDKLVEYLKKNSIPYYGPFDSMSDAVGKAKERAEEMLSRGSNTQIVLLSPGSGSHVYFENEFDRGDKFKEIVFSLTGAKNQQT